MKAAAPHLSKLQDRSTPMVFIGYEHGSKAYRFYDPKNRKVHVSRDVQFEEEREWSWEAHTDENLSQSSHGGMFTIHFEADHLAGGMEDHGEHAPAVDEAHGDAGVRSAGVGSGDDVESGGSGAPLQSGADTLPATPPRAATPVTLAGSATSSASSTEGPCWFRPLQDIYDTTSPTELQPEQVGLCLLASEEPTRYEEAVKEACWRRAMQEELKSIEDNATWNLVELTGGHKPIGLKWVFKVKKDSHGVIVKHKARLVAKGYVQRQGVDFDEVFAPVARMETVRLLTSLAAQDGWEVHHMDVKSAFLNGELVEEVYVSQPPGFEIEGQEHKVLKLNKALYGLRQAPRAWNAKLDKSLVGLGFERSPLEHAVYKKVNGTSVLLVGVYVDDLIITGSNKVDITEFKTQMKRLFSMSDLGLLSYYLGIEVQQTCDGITLCQSAYAAKILKETGMDGCNPCATPMEEILKLSKESASPSVDSTMYRSIVRSLRYLVNTRSDIAYSVGIVSRFMERPIVEHLNVVKRILRYVSGTLSLGCFYGRKNGKETELVGYSDSDLAGDVDDRKSTSGAVFYLGSSLVAWISQKQKVVALSSCEAEYIAATTAACQAIWLARLLGDLKNQEPKKLMLLVDNKSAISLCKNPVHHDRSKHIDTRYHFIRECVESEKIDVG